MDAITHMAQALAQRPVTREERRRQINRQNDLRRRDRLQWRWKLRRLAALHALFIEGGRHANH